MGVIGTTQEAKNRKKRVWICDRKGFMRSMLKEIVEILKKFCDGRFVVVRSI